MNIGEILCKKVTALVTTFNKTYVKDTIVIFNRQSGNMSTRWYQRYIEDIIVTYTECNNQGVRELFTGEPKATGIHVIEDKTKFIWWNCVDMYYIVRCTTALKLSDLQAKGMVHKHKVRCYNG